MTTDAYNLKAADSELANILWEVLNKNPSTNDIKVACKKINYYLYDSAICNAPQGWKAKLWAYSDALLDSRIPKNQMLHYKFREDFKNKIR